MDEVTAPNQTAFKLIYTLRMKDKGTTRLSMLTKNPSTITHLIEDDREVQRLTGQSDTIFHADVANQSNQHPPPLTHFHINSAATIFSSSFLVTTYAEYTYIFLKLFT